MFGHQEAGKPGWEPSETVLEDRRKPLTGTAWLTHEQAFRRGKTLHWWVTLAGREVPPSLSIISLLSRTGELKIRWKNLIVQHKGSLMKKKLCVEAKETKRFSCLLPI